MMSKVKFLTSNDIYMYYRTAPYRIFPLGDNAITVDFGNVIDLQINKKVISLFHQLKLQPVTGMIEAVPAYNSLTIYYDVIELRKSTTSGNSAFEKIKNEVELFLEKPLTGIFDEEVELIRIPVCYEREFATDIEKIAATKRITSEEIIKIHTSKKYKIYMMGFLPGFAYMGELDETIAMPRKTQPVQTPSGSVGIAGRQTGIYPLTSPGGWQIIGRTPLKLFDANRAIPSLLKAGDTIQFYSITKNEFESY
jgi:inhibitor of KinA